MTMTIKLENNMLLLLHRAKILSPESTLDQVSQLMQTEAKEIVQLLDGDSVALDLAGAYLAETGIGLRQYEKLHRIRRKELYRLLGDTCSIRPDAVAMAWWISFREIEKMQGAAELLHLCAWLDPTTISETLLVESKEYLSSTLASVLEDTAALTQAIGELCWFSLLQRDTESGLFQIHPSIQAALKASLRGSMWKQGEWEESAIRVVRFINSIFPAEPEEEPEKIREQYQLILPHALLCVKLIEQKDFIFTEADILLHKVGLYFYAISEYTQAEPLFKRSLNISIQAAGFDHADTHITRDYLIDTYNEQGKYRQIESLLKRFLTLYEQEHKPDHPDALKTLNRLITVYYTQSKYMQGEKILKHFLTLYEQKLGLDHPNIADILHQLATLYKELRQNLKAEKCLKRALAIYDRGEISDHAERAWSTVAALARLYRDQDKYELAAPLFQRALDIYEQKENGHDGIVRSLLASLENCYWAQEKYELAEPLAQRLLSDYEQTYGPDDEYTNSKRVYLATHYYHQKQYEQAESLFQQALASYEHILNPDLPDLEGYARLLQETGRHEEAEKMLARAQIIREKQQSS